MTDPVQVTPRVREPDVDSLQRMARLVRRQTKCSPAGYDGACYHPTCTCMIEAKRRMQHPSADRGTSDG